MKRRNFLKAIGIGAVVAPTVVQIKTVAEIPRSTGYIRTDGLAGEYTGGDLMFFSEYGTKIPADIYSDKALLLPHCNPVQSDSDGKFPPIHMREDTEYSVKCINREGVALWIGDANIKA